MIGGMKHDHPQFKLRIPPKLKEDLEQAAARHDRTLTAEIVARLDSSFVEQPGVSADSFVREMAFVRHAYERQINALTFGEELLARFLIAAADFLPNEVATAKQFAAALSLARGVVEKDADELVSAYAGLFPELKDEPVLDELRKMSEEHKRGEDVTHYMRQHINDTRAKWEHIQQGIGREPETPIADVATGKATARRPNTKRPRA